MIWACWIGAGKIKWQETIVAGIENAPKAFIGLFKGDNVGKMLVTLCESPSGAIPLPMQGEGVEKSGSLCLAGDEEGFGEVKIRFLAFKAWAQTLPR